MGSCHHVSDYAALPLCIPVPNCPPLLSDSKAFGTACSLSQLQAAALSSTELECTVALECSCNSNSGAVVMWATRAEERGS